MIDIITVTTHDAKKLAADLARLLEAEEHTVRLLVGRASEASIVDAQASRDGVLIIWSEDAPSQTYMREWLRSIDPARLIEISTAPGWPESRTRKAPVIDFSHWRGERGGRAWNALSERLRAVARHIEPPKPPARHAAAVLGIVSIAAVGVAAGVRSHQDLIATPEAPQQTQQTAQLEAPTDAVGGVLVAPAPASVDDLTVPNLRPLNTPLLHTTPVELTQVDLPPLPDVRDPTFIERLQQFNPLALARNQDNDAP